MQRESLREEEEHLRWVELAVLVAIELSLDAQQSVLARRNSRVRQSCQEVNGCLDEKRDNPDGEEEVVAENGDPDEHGNGDEEDEGAQTNEEAVVGAKHDSGVSISVVAEGVGSAQSPGIGFELVERRVVGRELAVGLVNDTELLAFVDVVCVVGGRSVVRGAAVFFVVDGERLHSGGLEANEVLEKERTAR